MGEDSTFDVREEHVCEISWAWARIASTTTPDWKTVRGIIVMAGGLLQPYAAARMLSDSVAVFVSPRVQFSASIIIAQRNVTRGASKMGKLFFQAVVARLGQLCKRFIQARVAKRSGRGTRTTL